MKKSELLLDPFQQFQQWYELAKQSQESDPEAMILATVDEHHHPHARVVLYKGHTAQGFYFYTNYTSNKACQITYNPHVALTLYWPKIYKQVRIEGVAKKISTQESADYFHSRTYDSQLSAIASHQSSVIASRTELLQRFDVLKEKYRGDVIPAPEYWGGYCVEPECIEFWQGRDNRLHDRFRYKRDNNNWFIERLSP